jgi:hypothetical protein
MRHKTPLLDPPATFRLPFRGAVGLLPSLKSGPSSLLSLRHPLPGSGTHLAFLGCRSNSFSAPTASRGAIGYNMFLGGPLKGFDGGVQFISLCDQEGKDVVSGHGGILAWAHWGKTCGCAHGTTRISTEVSTHCQSARSAAVGGNARAPDDPDRPAQVPEIEKSKNGIVYAAKCPDWGVQRARGLSPT